MKNLLTLLFVFCHVFSYSLDNLFPVGQNNIYFFDNDNSGHYYVDNIDDHTDRIYMYDISGDMFTYCDLNDAFIVSPARPLNGQIDVILKFKLIKFETNDPLCVPTSFFFGVGEDRLTQTGVYNPLSGDGEISLASVYGDLSQYSFLSFAFVGSGIGVDFILEIEHEDIYPPIPTMGQWSLICLLLLLLILGINSLNEVNRPRSIIV